MRRNMASSSNVLEKEGIYPSLLRMIVLLEVSDIGFLDAARERGR
jgi:hypothetical protein